MRHPGSKHIPIKNLPACFFSQSFKKTLTLHNHTLFAIVYNYTLSDTTGTPERHKAARYPSNFMEREWRARLVILAEDE